MIGEEVIAVYGDAGDGEEMFEVQKLVRCKDCKNFRPDAEPAYNRCRHFLADVEEDDWCSYGERKEESEGE